MEYWQFKFKEDGWSDWHKYTVEDTVWWKSPKNRLGRPNDIKNEDIVFLYKFDVLIKKGIYFIAKVINVDFESSSSNPIQLKIINDLKDNFYQPENHNFKNTQKKINSLDQWSTTYYKFDIDDNPKKLYNSIIKFIENKISLEGSNKGITNIPKGNKKPKEEAVITWQYKRNKEIKDWVLNKANGICESCNTEAPFTREDGSSFLEVHHLRRLSENGSDTVSNTIAVCPNCHRELHYGKNKIILMDDIYSNVDRLIKEL